MTLTEEQQLIIDTVQKTDCTFLSIDAVAGSGKTSTLVEITKTLQPKNGLYLAYNKAIATEAGTKFTKGTHCMTTHSLAYQNTIKSYNLKVGFFNYKHIKERIPYEHKIMLIELLNEFCLSRFYKFERFLKERLKTNIGAINTPQNVIDLTRDYFQKMIKGQVDITHAGYLKFYHMLLANNKLKHSEFDLIMLDEAGDLNAVTLEIFKLLPSNKKIMVGDKHQNIYTFNGTINGFKAMEGVGINLTLTTSFRCSLDIASRIEEFCKENINPSMEFSGTEMTDPTIKTVAYLSRTNSSLIGKMIELNLKGMKYNLTRPAKNIFELLLILLNLKPNSTIYAKEWKFLQEDADEWQRSIALSDRYDNVRKFIANKYKDDIAIGAALTVLGQYTYGEIYSAYESAKAHEKEKGHNITLCTVHSSKGLEWDKVVFLEDMNKSIAKLIDMEIWEYEPKHVEAMNLYYVGCSRAIKALHNADYLPEPDEEYL